MKVIVTTTGYASVIEKHDHGFTSQLLLQLLFSITSLELIWGEYTI